MWWYCVLGWNKMSLNKWTKGQLKNITYLYIKREILSKYICKQTAIVLNKQINKQLGQMYRPKMTFLEDKTCQCQSIILISQYCWFYSLCSCHSSPSIYHVILLHISIEVIMIMINLLQIYDYSNGSVSPYIWYVALRRCISNWKTTILLIR